MLCCQRSNPITRIIFKPHKFLTTLFWRLLQWALAMINKHWDSNAFFSKYFSLSTRHICMPCIPYKVNVEWISKAQDCMRPPREPV